MVLVHKTVVRCILREVLWYIGVYWYVIMASES